MPQKSFHQKKRPQVTEIIPENTAEYLIPDSCEKALQLLNRGYKPVAGGTDLMVRRQAVKKSLIKHDELPLIFSCGRIKGTDAIRISKDRLSIGSSVRLSDIINLSCCPEVLRESLLSIASPGIRNIATLTGNICNASPAADSLPALYVLNAEIETASLSADNSVVFERFPVSGFITGPGKTAAGNSRLVTSVSFEIPSDYSFSFRKIGTRAANALSKLSIASIYKNGGGIITDFRLAIGACAPTVIISLEAEKLIAGLRPADIPSAIDKVLKIYGNLINPIDDQRSTAAYRKRTALNLIRELLLNIGEQL